MITLNILRWTFVFCPFGLRGVLARHRWGIVGRPWPTLYVGIGKIMCGPRSVTSRRVTP
jgi:hypothetical protein